MAKSQMILEKPHHFRKIVLAIFGGLVALILVSEFTSGLFPFFEFVIAAIIIYFIARR